MNALLWRRSFCTLLVVSLPMPGCKSSHSQVSDDLEEVKTAVVGPQEAGWSRHDFNAYMTQWTDDAKMVQGRAEQSDKYDVTFDRKQIEATRRLLMHGPVAADEKFTFTDVQAKVDGGEAEVRLRITRTINESAWVQQGLYRLRKTPVAWKVYLNRGWPLQMKRGNETMEFTADTWRKIDERADDLVRTDKRGDRAAAALQSAWRFGEAHDLLKKVTDQKGAKASDWVQRGYAALSTGNAEEAMSAFRKALDLDPKASVPALVREVEQKK